MRKVFIVFMLVLMPLQASWAVAASYCTHAENDVAAQHFGHHADEHVVSASDTTPDDGSQSDSGNAPDQPHEKNCHHFSLVGLLNPAQPVFHHPSNDSPCWIEIDDNPNIFEARIERPNWFRLA